MMIRRVAFPLIHGRALLVSPECVVIRWPLESGPPVIDTRFPEESGAIVRGRADDWRGLLSGTPLSRCDAAMLFEIDELLPVYSYPQASNMRRVARELCPAVRESIVRGTPASLHTLIHVAWGKGEAEQVKRWNDALERRRR